jgi:hypothetical protein
MTQTQHLYSLGAKVGSKLIGTDQEDGSVDVILITAIGKERFFAKKVEVNGKPWEDGHESNWTLSLREWKLVE